MKEIVEKILENLVDEPDKIKVNVIDTSSSVVIEAEVAKTDVGKVIGKKGRTATAIRDLLSAMGGKLRKPVTFLIID